MHESETVISSDIITSPQISAYKKTGEHGNGFKQKHRRNEAIVGVCWVKIKGWMMQYKMNLVITMNSHINPNQFGL